MALSSNSRSERSNHWYRPAAFAIAARVFFWVLIALFPIRNEMGNLVSPLLADAGIDLSFYVESRKIYVHLFYSVLSLDWESVRQLLPSDSPFGYISGPVVPFMISIFDYRPGNALPLSTFYFVLGGLWVVTWVRWMAHQRLAPFWIYLFALLPVPYWLTLNIGTDLPFALLVAAFYFVSFRSTSLTWRRGGCLILLAALAVGTRPNGLFLFLFIGLIPLIRDDILSRRGRALAVVAMATISFLLFGLYSDYASTFMRKSMEISFFGASQSQYLIFGIFDSLPHWLNLPLSWLSLVGAKLMYLVGLRPSYSPDAPLATMLIRSSAGLLLLPGLVRWCLVGSWAERLFLFCMLLPFAIGAAQERFVLAIMPILFFHGALACQDLFRGLRFGWREHWSQGDSKPGS